MTRQIQDKVKEYISDNDLLTENEKIIIGVSGGADSMALLSILNALHYECIVAHCNFHLRGEESDRDEAFVKQYCKENKLEFQSVSFDTYKYMSEKNISLEMAARDLRYDWFEKLRVEYNINHIAIAHHQDDSVETILINLIRGTGIRGLTGISPRNGRIVRPLLCLSRNEIIGYLNTNQISFIEDSTNARDEYIRNKIRLNIIPRLEEINPSVKNSILKTSYHLESVEKIYRIYIGKAIREIFDGKEIDISKLLYFTEPKTILFELLYPYGFNPDTIDDIFESVKNNRISGKMFYSINHRLIKDRNTLILQERQKKTDTFFQINEGEKRIKDPLTLTIDTIVKKSDFNPLNDKKVLFADKSKITYPLIIRKWKCGDRFIPLGMRGSKKLSDYFTDNKYSITDKENTWILCTSTDEIIWIIGDRMDNRFRITEKTNEILYIKLYEK